MSTVGLEQHAGHYGSRQQLKTPFKFDWGTFGIYALMCTLAGLSPLAISRWFPSVSSVLLVIAVATVLASMRALVLFVRSRSAK